MPRKNKKRISVSSAKGKARKLQNDVKEMLLELFPELDEDDIRSTPMGVTGEDIQLSQGAKSLIPFRFECKSRKAFAIQPMYDQARDHAKTNKEIPVLVIRGDRKKALAVLDLETFVRRVWGRGPLTCVKLSGGKSTEGKLPIRKVK